MIRFTLKNAAYTAGLLAVGMLLQGAEKASPAKKNAKRAATATAAPHAVPSAAATPLTVVPGREAGAGYGQPVPKDQASHAGDRPDLRHEWNFRQRIYPGTTLDPNAYATGARHYLKERELTRQRELKRQKLASGGGELPNALPTGAWGEIGPAPITPSGFAFGSVTGRISGVALHPTNSNIMLIGSSRGGIWRTTDNGASWTPVGDNLPSLVIGDIKFAPSNGNIAYASTGDDDSFFWGQGVMKSTDGGITWARIDNGSAANGIENGTVLTKLTVDPTNSSIVVTAGYLRQAPTGGNFYSFVFRSADGGATWTKATIPTFPGGNQSGFRSLVIEPNCSNNLWIVDLYTQNIKRSTNGGANWVAVAAAGLPAFTSNTKIAVQHSSCAGSAVVYVSNYSGDSLAGGGNPYKGVYRSVDNGATFSLPGAAGPSGGCLAQCSYDHELTVDPTDSNRVYMIGRDIWTSTDAGATWTNRSAGFDDSNNYFGGNMHVDLHAVEIRGSGGTAIVYVAGDGGIWSYDVTANTFTNRNGNLAISEFMDLAVDPDTVGSAIGGLQDNGSIAWTGTSQWPSRLGGDGGDSGWLRSVAGAGNPFDGAFTTYIQNSGYRSTNGGVNWSNYGSSALFGSESAEFYAPWIGTVGDNRVWHGAQSLWYSSFPTNTWTNFASNLTGLTASTYVSKLAIHNPTAGSIGPLYVANAYPRAFLQSDTGASWNNRTTGLPDRYITDIEFNPSTPAQVWVTVQGFGTGHVWYSPDGGTTWQNRSGNLPNVPVNDIFLDPMDISLTWFAGTDIGVYGTADGGTTWSVVGTNMPAMTITDLDIDQNRMLYAATGGRSVWRIQMPGAVCSFGALTSATNNSTSTCRVDLAWSAASGACGAGVKYNVYRSTTNGVLGSRIAACVTGTTYNDQSIASGSTYYYTVRAETATGGSGPCQGGVEETNLTQRSATPGGVSTITAFNETAETGSGLNGWGTTIFGTQNGNSSVDWRGIESCTAYNGTRNFRNGGTTCAGTYSDNKWALAYPVNSTGVAIPAGATTTRLNFWHKWDYETSYDGAHLFVSTNGTNYYSVSVGAILAGAYNGSLIEDVGACGFSRPGGVGWAIWTGTSTVSFTNVIVDLDAACNGIPGNVGGCAGKSVRIGFAENSDCSGTQTGWFLDDVMVTYSAAGGCSAAAVPSEVSGGSTPLRLSKSGVNLGFSWQDQALSPQDYNLYRGTPGTWYNHTIYACHMTTPAITCASGSCSISGMSAGSGSQYFVLTSSNPGGEANAGASGWSGPSHTTAPVYTLANTCGGN